MKVILLIFALYIYSSASVNADIIPYNPKTADTYGWQSVGCQEQDWDQPSTMLFETPGADYIGRQEYTICHGNFVTSMWNVQSGEICVGTETTEYGEVVQNGPFNSCEFMGVNAGLPLASGLTFTPADVQNVQGTGITAMAYDPSIPQSAQYSPTNTIYTTGGFMPLRLTPSRMLTKRPTELAASNYVTNIVPMKTTLYQKVWQVFENLVIEALAKQPAGTLWSIDTMANMGALISTGMYFPTCFYKTIIEYNDNMNSYSQYTLCVDTPSFDVGEDTQWMVVDQLGLNLNLPSVPGGVVNEG